ncbi:uncharacterized protein ASCRUDRAFT_73823 [Ascoidea rubescens DSM 1968]|uniref:Uncharacterized protein n=1 Tax=Ascoidea rubescens DSM 1968 TaxID=1344418 RepID=A0A1D2VR88_9ASCO|nr:hypothetical protein ASCRUDRAFT_73823 [Ascoidea rubescens DSM 1968]ODV64124.1 hypothetical protein ASCRUDRAFT_73823 [Ascoidea rubescens DSM 1968]
MENPVAGSNLQSPDDSPSHQLGNLVSTEIPTEYKTDKTTFSPVNLKMKTDFFATSSKDEVKNQVSQIDEVQENEKSKEKSKESEESREKSKESKESKKKSKESKEKIVNHDKLEKHEKVSASNIAEKMNDVKKENSTSETETNKTTSFNTIPITDAKRKRLARTGKAPRLYPSYYVFCGDKPTETKKRVTVTKNVNVNVNVNVDKHFEKKKQVKCPSTEKSDNKTTPSKQKPLDNQSGSNNKNTITKSENENENVKTLKPKSYKQIDIYSSDSDDNNNSISKALASQIQDLINSNSNVKKTEIKFITLDKTSKDHDKVIKNCCNKRKSLNKKRKRDEISDEEFSADELLDHQKPLKKNKTFGPFKTIFFSMFAGMVIMFSALSSFGSS